MTQVYLAESKTGRSTFTIDYSESLKLFKLTFSLDDEQDRTLATRHTLIGTLDTLKPRLRHYRILDDKLSSYLP